MTTHAPARTSLSDLLLTALAPLIWGSTYLVTTLFLPPDRPFTAALLRVLPAGVLLLLAYRQMPAQGDWGRIALLGVLNIGLFQAMLFVAAYRLTGGLAAILTSTQTLMVLLLTWLLGGQMPPKAAWAWAAAGVVGIGLLVLSPVAQLDWLGVAAVNVGGYAYLCLVGAVLAYGLFFRGLARLSPAVVSSLGLLSPVNAFVLGWLFLGQRLDWRGLAGLVLALVSIAGVQRAMR